jgi:hypothetical protein
MLVDGKSCHDADVARRLAMVRECADVQFATLQDAVAFLKQEEKVVFQTN